MQDQSERAPRASKNKELTRECALTRATKSTKELMRFVLSPDGIITPDIDAKAPGRGVWITSNFDSVEQASKKNVFARSLKQKVRVPEDLAQITRTRLEQRLMGALGLARKAGQLQTGATRVKSTINGGTVVALLTALDAAPDGRRKMAVVLRVSGQGDVVPHFDVLTSSQLGLALGQENVIHAALTDGAAGKAALFRVRNLTRYMANSNERDDKERDEE